MIVAMRTLFPQPQGWCDSWWRTSIVHRRSQGGLGGHALPRFLEHIVILWFERRYPKQSRVIRLKSNIFPPKCLGWLRYCYRYAYNVSRQLWTGVVVDKKVFQTKAKNRQWFATKTNVTATFIRSRLKPVVRQREGDFAICGRHAPLVLAV